MRYVLAIKSPVYGSQGAFFAYQFANTLVEKGHQISQIFFFQQGVSHGNACVSPANDEFHLQKAWQQLSQQHQIPLHLCISASQRRGIIEQNLAPHFILAGLGEFSAAMLQADRVITL
ncbi:sulfurtransferase complex subunit TusD [Lonepinella sp. BR2271]|uniref:sulfurtransferase complex subunit TusD n=1 Tax=Lonepinella sp. BR2271 TaxID=3434550 RepID=UPI003F6E139D